MIRCLIVSLVVATFGVIPTLSLSLTGVISAVGDLLSIGGSPSSSPDVEPKTVEGRDLTIDECPYLATVQLFGSQICTGSIVAVNKILTAAQCVDGVRANSLTVRVSSSFAGEGGVVYNVLKIHQHPSFNPLNLNKDYDVAVLITNTITLSPKAQLTALARSGSTVPDGTLVSVPTWTNNGLGGSTSTTIKLLTAPILSHATCESTYSPVAITTRMLCTGDHDTYSCPTYYGGPAIYGGAQIGILSWGTDCGVVTSPGVYTKISDPEIHDFIVNSN